MTFKPERRSEITCPHCGQRRIEVMPTDACQFFYECAGCGERLRPKPGDCCVFRSYGSVPCPPIQRERFRRRRQPDTGGPGRGPRGGV